MTPKFSVDEIVAVDSALDSSLNTDRTLVLNVELFGPGQLVTSRGQTNDYWGFWYRLSHVKKDNSWVREASLRRLTESVSFETMMVELEI